MKAHSIVFGASGAAVVLLTGARISTSQSKTVNYWPFKEGSTWVLATTVQNKSSDQTITVSSVKPGMGGSIATLVYKVGPTVAQQETYLTTSAGMSRLSSGQPGSGTISPPIPIIKYPLKAGTSWTWKGDIITAMGKAQGTSTLTVSGPTSVVTPAGTFSAMQVHSDLIIMAQGQKVALPNDYWFAPNVGLVKQHAKLGAIEVNAVLKSYKLK